MLIQSNQNQQKTLKKKSDALVIGLFIFGLLVLLAVGVHMILKSSFSSKGTEKLAVEALKMKAGYPEDFKVTAISNLDSVFQNRYCPDYEVYDLSQKYLDRYLLLLDFSEDSMDKDKGNPKLLKDFKSFSRASETIDLFNEMLKKPQGDFCGWRLRMRYTCLDENKEPRESEAWLIFDRNKKHIINSFEFPIL